MPYPSACLLSDRYPSLFAKGWCRAASEAPENGARGPRARVRQFLWEQVSGPMPSGFVTARCGNPRCVAPEHAELRSRRKTFMVEQVHSVTDRKADETRSDASVRLGLHPDTFGRVRGPGGKRPASVDEGHGQDARRYAAGESLQAIVQEHDLTQQRVQQRIRRLAVSLGYDPSIR